MKRVFSKGVPMEEDEFRIRNVACDFHMQSPDDEFSRHKYGGENATPVPVIRVFGITDSGMWSINILSITILLRN